MIRKGSFGTAGDFSAGGGRFGGGGSSGGYRALTADTSDWGFGGTFGNTKEQLT